MATIKRAVTEQQKDVVQSVPDFIDDYSDNEGIQIPEFLLNRDEYIPTEDEQLTQAILNNTPNNNAEVEKMNHLNELERACQNWDVDEWKRVLLHADPAMMSDEIKRRLVTYQEFVNNQRGNMEALTSQKL